MPLQELFAKGFVRPILPGFKMPGEVAGQFLPDEEYAYAKDVDRVKPQVEQGGRRNPPGFFLLWPPAASSGR